MKLAAPCLIPVIGFLVACGGGGGSAPAVTTTSTAPTVASGSIVRLRGEFTIDDSYELVGTSPKPGEITVLRNKFLIKGTFDHLVRVENGSEGSLAFREVSPIKVNAKLTEYGLCQFEDPTAIGYVKSIETSEFVGTIGDRLSHDVKSSKLGPGDELVFAMEADEVTGVVSASYTHRNGNVISSANGPTQTRPSACQMLPTHLKEALNPTPGKARFSERWSLFPALGSVRPNVPPHAQLYDAIVASPQLFHVGVKTSTGRDEWQYKGTRVLANNATPTGTTQWRETIDLTWRIENP